MRYNDIICLISVSIEKDELGNQKPVETQRQVFANQFDISATEFYNASTQGLKPEKRFELYNYEYEGETHLIHNGKKYKIIRTQIRGERLRITCERVIGNG